MKEKTIISTCTLMVSLACYIYAKNSGKDAAPFVMVGGFIGALLGEFIASTFPDDNNPPSAQAA